MLFTKLCTVGGLAVIVAAQFPAKPEGVTVLESQLEEGVRISYKEVSYSTFYDLQNRSYTSPE